MKRPEITSILMAIALFAALYYAGTLWVEKRAVERRLSEQIERGHTLQAITESAQATLAQERADSRALVSMLRDDLADALKKQKAKPVSVTQAAVEAKPETVKIALRDTISIKDGSQVETWPFRVRKGRYLVDGAVYPTRREFEMTIGQEPLSLAVVVSQTKDGGWETVVDTGDTTLTVREIRSAVFVRRPGWWQRNKFYVGLMVGAGVMVGALR